MRGICFSRKLSILPRNFKSFRLFFFNLCITSVLKLPSIPKTVSSKFTFVITQKHTGLLLSEYGGQSYDCPNTSLSNVIFLIPVKLKLRSLKFLLSLPVLFLILDVQDTAMAEYKRKGAYLCGYADAFCIECGLPKPAPSTNHCSNPDCKAYNVILPNPEQKHCGKCSAAATYWKAIEDLC